MVSLGKARGVFRYDFCLVAIVVLLTLLGLVTLYSASYLFALNQPNRFGGSGMAPITSNFIAALIMVIGFPILAVAIELESFKKRQVIFGMLALTVFANLLPFAPFFQRANHRPGIDAMRWIALKLGTREFSFQPSELIKVVLPLYLAYILDKNKDRIGSFVYGPLPPVLWTGIFCVLVLFQSNFSEAVLIALTSLVICFIGGIRLRWFVIVLVLFGIIAMVLIFGDKEGRWYHRWINFGQHKSDPTGTGYQITESEKAIQTGGFWGKGIGQGTIKVSLPEVHGDFVFASYTEESGFIGVLFYFILVGIFGFICYFVAWRSNVFFLQLLIFGLATPIIAQTLLNIAVVANMIPTTGVPLPFVSSGGSSLLMTLTSTALLVNATRRYVFSKEGHYAW